MKLEFRLLTKEEIDVRVQSNTDKGAVLLLYKDARCDMNILDETVGATNWERKHDVVKENLFCTVSIYDEEKNSWVSKQDVGVESNTEAQKGEASDSFKRACFNWGIGRELYTAPFTYVQLKASEIDSTYGKNKIKSGVKFYVSHISYENKRISELKIVDQDGTLRFDMGKKVSIKDDVKTDVKQEVKENVKETNGKSTKSFYATINELIKGSKYTLEHVNKSIEKTYGKSLKINELTEDQFADVYTKLQDAINRDQASA